MDKHVWHKATDLCDIHMGFKISNCSCFTTDMRNFKDNGSFLAGMCGGPLPRSNEYDLSEIRFHWGRENSRGSEHTVNSKAFPMEVWCKSESRLRE